MWKRLKNNFDSGIEKIKWFSSLLSERFKIEYLVMKLLYQSGQLERKRDELMKTIGQRVYKLKEHPDRYILKDRVIMESITEIEKIDAEIEITKKKASEISSTI
ncbi:MAG: hypothetical protein COY75_06160 [Nitrospirae bacterium CG_4_10_14_0_8_um_filter_41_23]|nr:hypothetical protein [Nitrospirota bacterium]OIP59232.1 MAG: hypothetical protein AUK38_05920 [Nitrospirae bacterium CG2_30_41_42]PIQ95284.1 MAG: hypothetical protein COV68_00105 [Nitrospirae bacterium CG11_big_fil_rev_8_21_14_0_20_41_14]PIV44142.1 MAG: hypothetical protein COS27_02630 [Nitrospirae bacterium CG02_land_8_20_14_3_00_41_53]PIW87269.1 MAG: hypothetical protein COZ94_05815 [Nitrospirae bacterium CG_4_8_14_3_um_filter_41_47]PIY86838.1 MAG: hypothetical protein COY75_06160 [Nitros